MLKWLRGHWAALLATVPAAPHVWHGFVWLFDWGARIEVVANNLHHLGEVGAVLAFLLNPPPWSIFPALALVVVLFWIQNRIQVGRRVDPYLTISALSGVVCIGALVGYITQKTKQLPASAAAHHEPAPQVKKETPEPQNQSELSLSQLSDVALQRAAIEFSKRMRTFEANSRLGEPQRRRYLTAPANASDEQKEAIKKQASEQWDQDIRASQEYSVRVRVEFNNTYLPTARALRDQIEGRLKRAGKFPPYMTGEHAFMERYTTAVFDMGNMTGPNPVSAAADYLDIIARRLTD